MWVWACSTFCCRSFFSSSSALLPPSKIWEKVQAYQENFKTKRETQGKSITAAPPQEFHAWYTTGCGTLYPGQSLWWSWSVRQNLKVWPFKWKLLVSNTLMVLIVVKKRSFSCKQNPLRSSSDQMKALNKYCMLYIMLRVSGSVLLKVDKIPGVLKELSMA